jgi:deoxycytidine triphosphate deaminase
VHTALIDMILPGAQALRLGLIRNLTSESLQVQPCGIDLTLRRVLKVKSAGVVDFDNSRRVSAEAEELPFPVHADSSAHDEKHTGRC